MWLFYLYIIATFLLGSIYIGPFSIRVYCTLLMMGYLLIKGGLFRTRIKDRFIIIFAIYILITALTLYINGEIVEWEYGRMCLAYFLPCFVLYYSVLFFVNSPLRLKHFFVFLFLILIINGIVTILQFKGNPIGQLASMALTNSNEVRAEIMNENASLGSESFIGGIPSGLFFNSFTNANVIASIGIIVWAFWDRKLGLLHKMTLLVLVSFFLVSLFATQGRTPFLSFIFFSFLIVFKDILKNPYAPIIFLLTIIVFAIVLSNLSVDLDVFGRLFNKESYESDIRGSIWSDCFDFLSNHLLLGGPVSYYAIYTRAPHNYFLNAFINSGLIGGIIASWMYIYVILFSLRKFIHKQPQVIWVLAAAVLIYSINSLTHNASIISGDTLFFLLYSLLISTNRFNKQGLFEFSSI